MIDVVWKLLLTTPKSICFDLKLSILKVGLELKNKSQGI